MKAAIEMQSKLNPGPLTDKPGQRDTILSPDKNEESEWQIHKNQGFPTSNDRLDWSTPKADLDFWWLNYFLRRNA